MAKGDPVYGAHNDNVNQVFSMLGVIGTLGTSDVGGTANTLPIGVNPDNGAMYVDVMDTTFNVGTLTVGTINKVGTVSEVTNGSIKVTDGTVKVITPGTITSGSIAITDGTVKVITPGTITSGSIAVTSGTVSVNTPGTITSGSISVVAATINAATINAGTVIANLNAYRSSDTSYQPLRLDKATNSIQTMEYEHHEIHAGSHYQIANYTDLSINSVTDIQIAAGTTTSWAHLTFSVSVENETEMILYEGVTIATAGAALTPTNNDRNSSGTAKTTVYLQTNAGTADANADTDISAATIIDRVMLGQGKQAGFIERNNELILKQSTNYSLRMINNAAGYVNYKLQWYEHTNIA